MIYFGPYSYNYLENLEKLLTSFQKNKLRLNYQVVVYVTLMLSLPVVKKSLSMRKVARPIIHVHVYYMVNY